MKHLKIDNAHKRILTITQYNKIKVQKVQKGT